MRAATILIQLLVTLPLCAVGEQPGIEVAAQLEERSIQPPREVVLKLGSRLSSAIMGNRVPPIAAWSPQHARTIVLPDWAYSAEIVDLIHMRVKGRHMCFWDVRLTREIGAFRIVVDRLPFDESSGWVGRGLSRVTEVYSLAVDPIAADGFIYFDTNAPSDVHKCRASRNQIRKWKRLNK